MELSRIETLGRRKKTLVPFLFKTYAMMALMGIWLGYIYIFFNSSLLEGIFTLILLSPLSILLPKRNPVFICIFHFFLYPSSCNLWLLLGVSYFLSLTKKEPLINNSLLILILLVPSIFVCCLLMLRKKNKRYIEKAKTANDLLQIAAVVITGAAGIYALKTNDFSFLNSDFHVNLAEIRTRNYQDREVFNYIALLFTVPFLLTYAVSNAMLNSFSDRINSFPS
ncbi:hypothetical protein [Paenibacillus sp. HB172176]|uniref:hypothetical protein n=1 Tax=Paenibacillus sp. HB172176 TaxID=2493690 RepID=UPI001439FFDF|nr:hypothetical protein [Paenibacillus sp. HB172176]